MQNAQCNRFKTVKAALASLLLSVILCTIFLVACIPTKSYAATPNNYTAEITVKNYGTIIVELNRKADPETVDNFVTLAKSGFYNGLTFHRIMSGFMIQGGDPKGDGTGGSGTNIKG